MKTIAFTSVVAAFFLCAGSADARKKVPMKSPHKKVARACEACHVSTSFRDIEFNHNTTRFALVGRHERTNCLGCHSVENFSRVERNCVSCHEDVHLGQLGADCSQCHTSHDWGKFDGEDIHARTRFPLQGRHILLDCESCHQGQLGADFSQTPSRCVGCHQQNYLQVSRPDHVASGFPTDCQQCHQENGWRPATLPDHDPVFPIFSGTHQNKWNDCVACHTQSGNQRAFSCLGCHAHGQTLMDSNHGGISGYAYSSGSCYGCHPTGRRGLFVDHDAQFFPVFSGRHNGKWSSCNICHNNASSRKSFTCLQCHKHNQTTMNGVHGNIAGYSYTSSACLGCHPTGQKGQFVDHDAQFFPIYSGKHNGKWSACTTCHTNSANKSVFTCLQCHAHSQTTMNGVHGNIAGYSYTSSACLGCHPTGQKGQFVDHDAQFFPIYSGKHNGKWSDCATCHTNSANRSVFTCFQCHAHSQTKMDNKHLGKINGYSYQSSACYHCHPNGKG